MGIYHERIEIRGFYHVSILFGKETNPWSHRKPGALRFSCPILAVWVAVRQSAGNA